MLDNTHKGNRIEKAKKSNVSNFTFYVYILYLLSFFLHFSARIPAISVLRPDLVLAVIIWILLLTQRPRQGWSLDSPVFKILNIYLLYLLISTPFVEWPGSVIKNNLPVFLKSAFFLYFTVLIVDTQKRFKVFILIFVASQLIRILEPLYLHMAYGYWGSATYLGVEEGFADRLSGAPTDYINPNGLGMVIAITFPFVHYLWLGGSFKAKLTYFAIAPMMLYALVLSMSRSGLVAMLVIIWNIFKKSKKKLLLIAVGCVAVVALWGVMNDVQRDRYLSLTGDQEVRGADSAGGRLRGMIRDFETAFNRPIVGYGLGTSKEAIAHDRGKALISHTLYAEVWIETGVIGLFIYLFFLKAIYKELQASALLIKEVNSKGCANEFIIYAERLLAGLFPVFWMLMIFSIAQYGLSEWHWYLFAGMVIVLKKLLEQYLETKIQVA